MDMKSWNGTIIGPGHVRIKPSYSQSPTSSPAAPLDHPLTQSKLTLDSSFFPFVLSSVASRPCSRTESTPCTSSAVPTTLPNPQASDSYPGSSSLESPRSTESSVPTPALSLSLLPPLLFFRASLLSKLTQTLALSFQLNPREMKTTALHVWRRDMSLETVLVALRR